MENKFEKVNNKLDEFFAKLYKTDHIDYKKNLPDELWNYFDMKSDDTGLTVKIWIDHFHAFEQYKHPVWVYVENRKPDDNGYFFKNMIAMTVSNEPLVISDSKTKLYISPEGIIKIKTFIINNAALLKAIAYEKIDSTTFHKKMKTEITSKKMQTETRMMLNEMGVFKKDETGVGFGIQVMKKCAPHGPRIKFQPEPSNGDPHTWPFIQMNGDIVGKYDKKYVNKYLDRLIEFKNSNEYLLYKLWYDDEYKFEHFKQDMKYFKNGILINPSNTTQRFFCGYEKITLKSGYFQFKDEKGNLLTNEVFKHAYNFKPAGESCLAVVTTLNDKKYWLDTNGKLIKWVDTYSTKIRPD